MVADKNKGITSIEYNDFNLPTKIHFSTEDASGKYIEYVYDASGVKLRKLVKDEDQSNYHISLYAGAYIYEQKTTASSPSLKFILQPEGYFEPTGTSASGQLEGAYTYQYRDHLGNIRLSYSDIDGNGVIDPATEIKEAKDYYAFGLEHNVPNKQIIGTKHPYGYKACPEHSRRGKEENDELGLEWLDFGARNYNASLARWMNVDPLAEEAPEWTPYRYGFNNPVKYIDPDGMFEMENQDIIINNKDGNEIARIILDTGDYDYVVEIDIDYEPAENNQHVLNLDEIIENAEVNIDAVGINLEASATIGGGMETGVSIVYFLNGEDAGSAALYTQVGGNVGWGAGVGGDFFTSTFNEEADNIYFSAKGFEGGYNGWSANYFGVGYSVTWSNEEGTHNEVRPGHRHKTTWTSVGANGGWSPTRVGKFGAKFSGGTSTYQGALELKSQERK